MVPGNLIEWTYELSGQFQLVDERETLWSTPMKCYVPIGTGLVHILVSIDDEQISWLNEEGCFQARMDDTFLGGSSYFSRSVLPRVYG